MMLGAFTKKEGLEEICFSAGSGRGTPAVNRGGVAAALFSFPFISIRIGTVHNTAFLVCGHCPSSANRIRSDGCLLYVVLYSSNIFLIYVEPLLLQPLGYLVSNQNSRVDELRDL